MHIGALICKFMPEFDVFYQNWEKCLCFGAQYFSSLFTKMRKSGLNEGEKVVIPEVSSVFGMMGGN